MHYKPKTVLIVDDNKMIRRVVSMLVTDDEHTALTAPNLSAARIALACAQVDLICCDFNLGGGETGLQLLEEIQALPPQSRPKFLLMSGDSLAEINPSHEHEFEYIAKPFDVRVFRLLLEKFLGKSQSVRLSA